MSDVTSHQTGDGTQNGFIGKDPMHEDFAANYMQQPSQQPSYAFPPNEQYIPNYYGQMAFPSYMGEWSTGGESVPYLSPYNNVGNGEPHRNFMQDAMFGQQTSALGNGQAYFNAPVFQQGNEFTAWTSPTAHTNTLDSNIGHQSGNNTYNGDFYQQILPPMPQDYLERSEVMNNPTTVGNLASHGPHGGYMSGGMSSGDDVNKIPGSSNSVHMLEHGMQALHVAGMGGDAEPGNPGKTGQVLLSGGSNHMDSAVARTDYGGSPIQAKLSSTSNTPQAQSANKPISWAAIASKPAKPQAKPKPKSSVGLPPPVKHGIEAGNWEAGKTPPRTTNNPQYGARGYGWSGSKPSIPTYENREGDAEQEESKSEKDPNGSRMNSVATPASNPHPVLDKLQLQNEYNPKRLTIDLRNSRFFVIKSYSEDDIHRSIKYNIWCSTEHGNKRLDATFRAQKNRGPVILLYSVNGSGHFCGVAEMKTCVDYSSRAGVWSQDKWKGKFQVKWIYVKDVPNTVLRHIRLENNDNKPVTNSRDTQEVPAEKGRQVLKIIANYKHQTSIFDDFGHYERRQQDEETQKNRAAQAAMNKDRKPSEYQQNYQSKNPNA